MLTRKADGTSRATFDSTEQAAWAVTLPKQGTLAQVALALRGALEFLDFVPDLLDTSAGRTAAIKAALDANPGKWFVVPPGNIRCTTQLDLGSNNGLIFRAGTRIYADAPLGMPTLMNYGNGQAGAPSFTQDMGMIGPGVIAGNLNAQKALAIGAVIRFTLNGFTIKDPINRGIWLKPLGAEVISDNIRDLQHRKHQQQLPRIGHNDNDNDKRARQRGHRRVRHALQAHRRGFPELRNRDPDRRDYRVLHRFDPHHDQRQRHRERHRHGVDPQQHRHRSRHGRLPVLKHHHARLLDEAVGQGRQHLGRLPPVDRCLVPAHHALAGIGCLSPRVEHDLGQALRRDVPLLVRQLRARLLRLGLRPNSIIEPRFYWNQTFLTSALQSTYPGAVFDLRDGGQMVVKGGRYWGGINPYCALVTGTTSRFTFRDDYIDEVPSSITGMFARRRGVQIAEIGGGAINIAPTFYPHTPGDGPSVTYINRSGKMEVRDGMVAYSGRISGRTDGTVTGNWRIGKLPYPPGATSVSLGWGNISRRKGAPTALGIYGANGAIPGNPAHRDRL